MKHSRWQIGFAMVLGIIGIAMMFKLPAVSAATLSNIAPNPNSSAPGAEVFFLRQSPYGTQETIKVRAYYPNMASGWNSERLQFIPNQDAGQPCSPKPGGPTPNNQYIKVTLKTAGNAAEIYLISYANICQPLAGDNQQGQVPSNRFYANYPLPPKPAINGNSGRLQVDVTIEYGPAVTGDAGGLRLQIKGSAGTLVGQLGGGQEAFPVIGTAQSVTGSAQPNIIRVPFGVCADSVNDAQIGVYDADQGGFGGLYVRAQVKNVDTGQLMPLYVNAAGTYTWGGVTYNLYHNGGHIEQFGNGVDPVGDALLPNDGSGNQANAFISAPLKRNVHYELIISNVAPKNTIDLLIPGDAYFGDPGHTCKNVCTGNCCIAGDPSCGGGIPNPPTGNQEMTLTGSVSGGGSVETGGQVSFNGTVTSDTFPDPEVGGWGYNEVGVRKGKNIQKPWNTGHYNTDHRGPAGVNQASTKTIKCAGGNWNPTCANYTCWNGNTASNCTTNGRGGYRWRCEINANIVSGLINTNSTGPGSVTCPAIYQHYCAKSGTEDAAKTYRDFDTAETNICDRYFCIFNGSETNVAFDSPPGYAGFCRVFHCYVDTDPGAPDEAAQVWYDANDNSDNPNDPDIPGACKNRCSAGTGSRPYNYLQPDPYGQWANDLRCYQKPKVAFTCNWNTSDVQGPINAQYTIGSYNCGTITVTRVGIGQRICVVMTPALVSGWTPDGPQPSPTFAPPGMGLKYDNVTPWIYNNWTVKTVASQPVCADWTGLPYFKVFGSDVRVGGGIGTAGACQTNTAANILAWNQGLAPAYSGSGTQYAAMATGFINGFVSGQFSGNNGNPNPAAGGGGYSAPGNALSFANTGANFGPSAAPGCVDYVPAGMSPTVFTGTLVPLPIVAGTNTVQYIKGDVFINSPIQYNPGVGVNGLTGYRLVVDGNIYIGKGVLRLDGTYVALNNSDASKGYIYTCADGVGSEAQLTLSGCKNQLVVNGSLVARTVQLLRDCGSLTYSPGDSGTYETGGAGNQEQCGSDHAAEIFNYSPELWLIGARTVKVGGGTDSMRSLPPVL